jgi:hypothetical protein
VAARCEHPRNCFVQHRMGPSRGQSLLSHAHAKNPTDYDGATGFIEGCTRSAKSSIMRQIRGLWALDAAETSARPAAARQSPPDQPSWIEVHQRLPFDSPVFDELALITVVGCPMAAADPAGARRFEGQWDKGL